MTDTEYTREKTIETNGERFDGVQVSNRPHIMSDAFEMPCYPDNTAVTELTGTVCGYPREDDFININKNHILFQIGMSRLAPSVEVDVVLVSVNQNRLAALDVKEGTRLAMKGTYRSYRYNGEDGKRHLVMYFYPSIVREAEDEPDRNFIYGTGYICQKWNLRATPLSGRMILDFKTAVPRVTGGDDYLVNIAWGRLAESLSEVPVGQKIRFCGRIQSRQFQKNGVMKTVNEISMFRAEPA